MVIRSIPEAQLSPLRTKPRLKDRRKNGIPVNDNTMVELADLCNYLKIDFSAYFKDYELPKESKFFGGNYLVLSKNY